MDYNTQLARTLERLTRAPHGRLYRKPMPADRPEGAPDTWTPAALIVGEHRGVLLVVLPSQADAVLPLVRALRRKTRAA